MDFVHILDFILKIDGVLMGIGLSRINDWGGDP
jgi:hypothetical protein